MMRFRGGRSVPALLIGAVLFFIGACDHLAMQQLIDPPKVDVLEVIVDDVTKGEATVVVAFGLKNTNPMSMELSEISYTLRLNGQKFVKGISRQRVQIPVIGGASVMLPVTFTFMDLFSPTASDTGYNGDIPIHISGALNIGPFSVPYKYSGSVALSPS